MSEEKTKEKKSNGKKIQEDNLAEITDLLKRTQASFENYRKQTEKRIDEIREMASKEIILQLLPVLDNFELALKNIGIDQDNEFVKGIELIYSQMMEILKDNGVETIRAEGKFDPHMHEALMKEVSDKEEDTIITELMKGFTLRGQVIRHAKVKLSAGKQNKYNEGIPENGKD